MAEVELLAELELAVQLVVLVQEGVQSQGRQEWMRKIGVDHNMGLARVSPPGLEYTRGLSTPCSNSDTLHSLWCYAVYIQIRIFLVIIIQYLLNFTLIYMIKKNIVFMMQTLNTLI